MRYALRQHLLALGDDFTITDDAGRPRYTVDGHVFTIRNATTIRDAEGREVARLHRCLLSLGETFEIERDGKTTVVHKHLFTPFRCRFSVDVPGPDDLEATGDLLDHEYTFRDAAGHTVAAVSKRWFRLADTYGVEIADGPDAPDHVLILAAAVVIDLCCHPDKKR
jgi:uncharacterized protein YxjI